jgi:hypothetical protein
MSIRGHDVDPLISAAARAYLDSARGPWIIPETVISGDRRRAQPVGRRQHNPGAPDVLLGAVAVIDDRLQALAISRAQIDGDVSTQPADSHDAKAMGIPTRTLTWASIH